MISIKVDKEIRDFMSELGRKFPNGVAGAVHSFFIGMEILLERGEWSFHPGGSRFRYLLFFPNSKAQVEFEEWLRKNRPEDLL